MRARYIYLIQEMHRPFVPHVEAVVAPDHDALGAHLADHELHDGFRVDQGVKREPLQIFARRLRQPQLFDFRPHCRTVVNASHQHQQHAAAVRQAELKLRVPVEYATENKVAGGDGGVEREAQHVREIKRRGALSANHL